MKIDAYNLSIFRSFESKNIYPYYFLPSSFLTNRRMYHNYIYCVPYFFYGNLNLSKITFYASLNNATDNFSYQIGIYQPTSKRNPLPGKLLWSNNGNVSYNATSNYYSIDVSFNYFGIRNRYYLLWVAALTTSDNEAGILRYNLNNNFRLPIGGIFGYSSSLSPYLGLSYSYNFGNLPNNFPNNNIGLTIDTFLIILERA